MSKIKDSIYNYLVRRNTNVRYEYEKYVMEHTIEHYEHRFLHWKILWKLNWHYCIKKNQQPLLYWKNNIESKKEQKKVAKTMVSVENKVVKTIKSNEVSRTKTEQEKAIAKVKLPYLEGAESRSTKWMPPQDMIRMLLDYDVISFDIFDTLIFRPFERPQDIFFMVGAELNVLDFYTIRMNAEKRLRDEKYKKYGHREITLDEIYQRIEAETGINAQMGKAVELRIEKDMCHANPYMLYVLDTILAQEKDVILVSDMYITKEDLSSILHSCGMQGYKELFISCDYACSKRDGGLYRIVKEFVGEERTCIHIGDNKVSDIECVEKAGIKAYHYENVNTKGKTYRTDEITGLIGSAYRGIVNEHLHNGFQRYDAYYEFGFVYGGLLMFGYAQYIHKYAIDKHMDRVIFVARDGYIIKKVYDRLFQDIKSEYMLCSRISNLKLAAYCSKNDYMKEFVLRWVKEKKQILIYDVIENMGLLDLLDIVKKYVNVNDNIEENSTQKLVEFVNDNWEQIKKVYDRDITLAQKYYSNFLKKDEKVLIVDIGWRGQTILALRNLERDYWHFGCEIYGILAASAPTSACLGQLQTGIIDAFMFSPIKNITSFKWHSKNSINNILTELFAGAPSPSFKGFEMKEDGDYELLFDVPEMANYEIISKIHKGIYDFAEQYETFFKKYPYMYVISGNDAYMPAKHILKDYSFIKRFLGRYEFQDCVGGTSGDNSRKIRDVFNKFNL